jgi:hypothetical protein
VICLLKDYLLQIGITVPFVLWAKIVKQCLQFCHFSMGLVNV